LRPKVRRNDSKYLTHWAELVNSATDVSKETACREFIRNFRYNALQDKLKCKKPKRVTDLVAIATIYAESDHMKDESDEEWRSKKSKSQPSNNNPPKNNKLKGNDGGSELVANANKGSRKNQRHKGGKSEYT
jgi:hypothetical protein